MGIAAGVLRIGHEGGVNGVKRNTSGVRCTCDLVDVMLRARVRGRFAFQPEIVGHVDDRLLSRPGSQRIDEPLQRGSLAVQDAEPLLLRDHLARVALCTEVDRRPPGRSSLDRAVRTNVAGRARRFVQSAGVGYLSRRYEYLHRLHSTS